jgi:uncharacterized cupredoxin-like copper-binding protein
MRRFIGIAGALLLAVAVRAEPPVDWLQAEPINMLLLDNRFVPDHLHLRHGVPYQLQLENDGSEVHQFTAPEFFADSILLYPEMLSAGGQEIVLEPGRAVVVYFVATRPGTFRLYCPDHDWDGMVGEIVVE